MANLWHTKKNPKKRAKILHKSIDKGENICYNMRCEYEWGIAKR